MPKNTKGGKKGKKGKKLGPNMGDAKIVVAEEGQSYGKVLKNMGPVLSVQCIDDKVRVGVICGKLWKRVWIREGDIVLISLRSSTKEDDKCDVIGKFTAQQARKLVQMNEIKFQVIEEPEEDGKTKSNVKFKDDVEDEDEDAEDADPFAKMKAKKAVEKKSTTAAKPASKVDTSSSSEEIDIDSI